MVGQGRPVGRGILPPQWRCHAGFHGEETSMSVDQDPFRGIDDIHPEPYDPVRGMQVLASMVVGIIVICIFLTFAIIIIDKLTVGMGGP
jgi:hypothetical protein